jgi:PBSX family phage terminase large subunit
LIDLKLNAKQSLAWDLLEDDVTTEILYGGAAGGGKSFLGIAFIITMCIQYEGTRWLIGRSELESLKKTTLNTFFDVCSMWGIKGDDIHYKYNVHEKTITFKNGSEILLFDLKLMPSDPNFDGLGSLELTGAFIDEANQVTEKAKNIVSSRIRYKLDKYNLIPKLLMTCNPAKGWVYDEFYKKEKDKTLEIYKGFIQALPTDNPEISKHYIEQLKKLDDFSKRRLLYGEWEYEDTLALVKYDSIIRMFNTDDYLQPIKSIYYLSCDIARLGADKTVIVLWRDLSIVKIFTLTKATVDVTINKIKELTELYKIERKHIVIDTDGVGGGVADFLKGCISFMNNGKPLNGDNYKNLKTQCYYRLAQMIHEEKIKVLSITQEAKEKLIQELEVIRVADIDKDTKLSIISKEQIKQIIGRSPDFSDAIMFRMYWELKPVSSGKYFMKRLQF